MTINVSHTRPEASSETSCFDFNQVLDVLFTFGSAFSMPFVDMGKIVALDPHLDAACK